MNGGPHEAIVCGWNDLDLLHRCLAEHGDEVAGCIMEPVMGNAGVLPPDPQFLAGAREALHDCGALLLFDEVITGMRIDSGGAQEYYGVQPDITILSKAVGGGYPIALFGTTREIMQPILDGTMFHGGVYSSNAIVMSAANAVLDTVLDNKKGIYKYLHRISDRLADGVTEIMQRLDVPMKVQHVGPMISMFLTTSHVEELCNYREVRKHCDFDRYIQFQHEMQRLGVYLHPNMFEPIYLSTAHTDDDITSVLERVEDAAKTCLVR
ncbi:MAG: aminotransferase class III-fold pyridoxal phosphate-dependent enzyme [Planctomycetes bacterium]|nr:aminotransferase class III-fold pyridoxal phosphate-dependent enzyme [Planctomycetota bacterium]